MSTLAASDDNTRFTIVDRPKIAPRLVTLMVWAAACFLFYKATEAPAPPWVVPITSVFFILCCCLMIREFMFRPTRVTTLSASGRELRLQETAPLRSRELSASLPRGAAFEILQRDWENTRSYQVRIKSNEHNWLTIAEYLSKEEAENIAEQGNRGLREV